MNRNVLLLGILVLMIGGYFLFVYQPAPKEFAVKETDQIGKVTLQSVAKGKELAKLVLEKQEDGSWTVNEKYVALEPRINKFLEILSSLYDKKDVPEKGKESALKIIKKDHTLVTIEDEDGGQMNKYYVGPTDNRQTANIMLLYGDDEPHLISIPGLEGYVSIHFTTDLNAWRERLLFNAEAEDLQEVSISYRDREGSFSLSRPSKEGAWSLSQKESPVDPTRVEEYLKLFTGKIFAEDFVTHKYPEMVDSLKKRDPDVVFGYETFSGREGEVYLFARPENLNNYFGFVKDDPELYTVQHFVFDKFLKQGSFFMAPPS